MSILMRRLIRSRYHASLNICLLLTIGPLCPASAQDTPQQEEEAEPDVAVGSIDDVPEFLKTGQYEQAVAVLRALIDEVQELGDLDTLQHAYLLLIKTYTVRGNFYRSEGDDTSADLYNKEARALIVECLQVRELRHTNPDSPLEYPPEMYALFDDVRSEIFGSFRVIGLEPPEAIVILDADTLRTLPDQEFLSVVDIPIGAHEIVVIHEGYRTISDFIDISSGVTLERNYRLSQPRSNWWYIGLGSLLAAGVVGTVAALSGSDTPAEETPLPGPPAPPQ
jgi:hypothetical protein